MRTTKKSFSFENKIAPQVLLATSAITLFFTTSVEDPFNSPKMWLLMLSGAWFAGCSAYFIKQGLKSKLEPFTQLVILFVIFLLIASIQTDVKLIGFFGDTQRRIGFVTYLFLSVFALVSSKIFSIKNSVKIIQASVICLVFLSSYGFAQSQGRDFVQWQNPYNQVLGTLGNPNFASATLALLSSSAFCAIFIKKINLKFKLFSGGLFLLSVYIIWSSDSLQGLVALSLSLGFFIGILISIWNKKASYIYFIAYICVGFTAIAGMLQSGPLQNLLYKNSVSVRGYYWRAGIEMFLSNWFSGVGIDRYGYFFKEYREPEYSLIYGYEITSSNAHNVPIQMFATGGLITGVLYIAMILYIFKRSFKVLFTINNSEDKIVVASVFSLWLVYCSQLIISIENIGLAIWGWVIMGALIGISSDQNSAVLKLNGNSKAHSNTGASQIVTSWILVLVVLIPISFLFRAEKSMLSARDNYNQTNPQDSPKYLTLTSEFNNMKLLDYNYQIRFASGLFGMDQIQNAKDLLVNVNKKDPRNLDALHLLAAIAQANKDIVNEIKYLRKIEKLDPWNALNLFNIGILYRDSGDFANMNQYKSKILDFVGSGELLEKAKIELVTN